MSQSTAVPQTRIIFVDDDYQEKNRKRVASRACEDCRRKKKRCTHVPAALPSDESLRPEKAPSASDHQPEANNHQLEDNRQQTLTTAAQAQAAAPAARNGSQSTIDTPRSYPRFIGDLNPERDLRSPADRRQVENSVGVWHDDVDASFPRSRRGSISEFAPGSLFYHCSQLTRRLLLPIMDEQCLQMRPPDDHLQAMELYYFRNIHSILPAVDESTYRSTAPGSAAAILQAQTICLVVHTNPCMHGQLQLLGRDGVLAPAEFGRKILGAMRLNIELARTADKAVLIRTLATISLFAYTRDAIELNSQFFVRAVHLAFTIGLHQQQHEKRADSQKLDGLFCYIWAIDRLHAAMQGRPVIIHQRDMSITTVERCQGQLPGLQVFVRIAALLDIVIGLYRPTATEQEIPASDCPTFENVLAQCDALDLSAASIETLELLYHAVLILSCRIRTGNSEQSAAAPNSRQNNAAAQITKILIDDTTHEVLLLPYVPYAVSLSLSTQYRQIRYSKVQKFRTRAQDLLLQNYHQLQDMASVFWSAAVMSELASKIVIEAPQLPHPPSTDINQAPITEGTYTQTNTSDSSQMQAEQNSYGFDFDGNLNDIEGLLDANLELGMPTFFPDYGFEFTGGWSI